MFSVARLFGLSSFVLGQPHQTTRQVSVRRTPTAPAMPVVIQLPSDCMSGLSTNAIRSYRPVTA